MTRPSAKPRTQSALIDAYLADLDRALRRGDPAEREEVVAAVTEHIEAALADKPQPVTTRDVEDVLQALGSVDSLAAEIDPQSNPTVVVPPAAPAWPRWTAVLVVIVASISLPLVLLSPLASGVFALTATAVGVLGTLSHPAPHKWPYRVASLVGAATLALFVVGAIVAYRS